MFRDQLPEALRTALKEKDQRAVSTLRLIMAALKDRDIAARGKGNDEGIDEDEILQMLQTMVKQRRDSTTQFQDAGRDELAAIEIAEIAIIQEFLPKQLSEDEIIAMIDDALSAIEVKGMAAMGALMGAIKPKLQGRADMGAVSKIVKAKLTA